MHARERICVCVLVKCHGEICKTFDPRISATCTVHGAPCLRSPHPGLPQRQRAVDGADTSGRDARRQKKLTTPQVGGGPPHAGQ